MHSALHSAALDVWVKMLFLDCCCAGQSETATNEILERDNCIATWQVTNAAGQATQVHGHVDAPPAAPSLWHRRAASARAHFLSL